MEDGKSGLQIKEKIMKRFILVSLFLGISLSLHGAPPTRQFIYKSGETIEPSEVTTNEDQIFNYLTAGVDTLANNSVTSAKIVDATIATADIANNAVNGTKIAMGSDAQGDVIYYDGTDYVRLGAGTSGQFLKTNGTSSNPEWDAATTIEVGGFSKDTSDATGTQEINLTGAFKPIAVTLQAFEDGTGPATNTLEASLGFDDGTRTHCNYIDAANDLWTSRTDFSIYDEENTATDTYQGKVSSFDSDGFTITWTKVGTPTGTLKIKFMAYK